MGEEEGDGGVGEEEGDGGVGEEEEGDGGVGEEEEGDGGVAQMGRGVGEYWQGDMMTSTGTSKEKHWGRFDGGRVGLVGQLRYPRGWLGR
ncbi:hypothetical protein chiPu_0029427, partial [Chiloscyllium punctatum]|nr:hypothetical protein [Chiloscyllium punctatum]